MFFIRNVIIVYLCLILVSYCCTEIYHDALLSEKLSRYTAGTLFTVTSRYKIETAICNTDQFVYYGTIPAVASPTPVVAPHPTTRSPSIRSSSASTLSAPTILNARLNQNFDYGVCGGPVYNVGDTVLTYYDPVLLGRKQNVVLVLSNESMIRGRPFLILTLTVFTAITICQKLYRKFCSVSVSGGHTSSIGHLG